MSTTVHLVCTSCRERLWIGQIWRGEESHINVYMNDDEHARLGRFLGRHFGHPMITVHDDAACSPILEDPVTYALCPEFEADNVPVAVNLNDKDWRADAERGLSRMKKAGLLK